MTPPLKIRFYGKEIYHEADPWAGDPELTGAVKECVGAQKKAAAPLLQTIFSPNADASRQVSEDRLREILQSEKAVNGIRTEKEISNVVVFNDRRYEKAVFSTEISESRKRLDRLVTAYASRLFEDEKGPFDIHSSGFFLYPPGGYMGWHTNWQNPGWRLYISYAEEPGKSFFRYRDPETGQIVTSPDKGFHLRVFRATDENPFWHAIYSETHRYSLGYKIALLPKSFLGRLKRKIKRRLFL